MLRILFFFLGCKSCYEGKIVKIEGEFLIEIGF